MDPRSLKKINVTYKAIGFLEVLEINDAFSRSFFSTQTYLAQIADILKIDWIM